MPGFCRNCGSPCREGIKFCPNCGVPLIETQNAAPQQPVNPQQPIYPHKPYGAPDGVRGIVFAPGPGERHGIPAPGFSDRIADPEILAAVKKSRKAAGIFTLFLVPLPLIGFVLYSLFSGEMEIGQAALIGGVISAVFLLFTLIGRFREREQNSYEAVVTEQKTHQTYRRTNSDESKDLTEYITVIQTTDGKKKKIVEREGSPIWAYNYLGVGDRFRYHPQFHFPYEKFDKSTAPYLACTSCGTHNPVEADRCSRCGLPLLK